MSEIGQKIHKQFSVQCFNACWDLIEKADSTPDDMENMILLASASLWHWKQRADCMPSNLSTGYWQMARVMTLAGQFKSAHTWAERCQEISEAEPLGTFYLGYAHEAFARLAATQGDTISARQQIELAKDLLRRVDDDEERSFLEADLNTIPVDGAGNRHDPR